VTLLIAVWLWLVAVSVALLQWTVAGREVPKSGETPRQWRLGGDSTKMSLPVACSSYVKDTDNTTEDRIGAIGYAI
jgi:hypothetical protein